MHQMEISMRTVNTQSTVIVIIQISTRRLHSHIAHNQCTVGHYSLVYDQKSTKDYALILLL